MSRIISGRSTLPVLPLLLWDVPPGLELALAQEGVPHRRIEPTHPLAFRAGRFVLYDGQSVGRERLRAMLTPEHAAIDVARLVDDEEADPYRDLVDAEAAPARWRVDGLDLIERVSRKPKAAIRDRLIGRLRAEVDAAGGIWARLALFPCPYRSAFNFRADLDESSPEDYARFARARRPIDDCTTHFVSTRAYGQEPAVLADLRGLDAQSHGHHHVAYRDPEANRRNLQRAHATLVEAGIEPVGFAAPHGRWNRGLDDAVAGLGYQYASDFHLGRDDLPFFPWLGDRFSTVLQVPIHPVCEGLFLDAGAGDDAGRMTASYLARVVRAKVRAGEPAFVYGHPERRLARFPEILETLAGEVADEPLLWRVTLTEFADWWRWRGERSWTVVAKDGRYEAQFDDWDARYPLAIEIVRGKHSAMLPIRGPRAALRLEDLAYEARNPSSRADLPEPTAARGPIGWRSRVREALDWETVTPLDELPRRTLTDKVKKQLRTWQAAAAGGADR